MKGAVSESRGSVWKKAKTEKQLEVLWFFSDFQRNNLYFLAKTFATMTSQRLFACPEKFFDDFWREIFFFFFLFWTLTVRILRFVQISFNMSETFSAVWPKFIDRHVRRAFYASIQTLRNLLSDIEKTQGQVEKSSKTSKNFVTWEKNIGSTVFRQRCWNCNLCVHLNNLKPSEFKTLANLFGTMSKNLFGLRKTLLAVILKLHFFPQEKVFKKINVYRIMCTSLQKLWKLDVFYHFRTLSDDFFNVCVKKLRTNFLWRKKFEMLIFFSI